jgi:hypothetical protein
MNLNLWNIVNDVNHKHVMDAKDLINSNIEKVLDSP